MRLLQQRHASQAKALLKLICLITASRSGLQS